MRIWRGVAGEGWEAETCNVHQRVRGLGGRNVLVIEKVYLQSQQSLYETLNPGSTKTKIAISLTTGV